MHPEIWRIPFQNFCSPAVVGSSSSPTGENLMPMVHGDALSEVFEDQGIRLR